VLRAQHAGVDTAIVKAVEQWAYGAILDYWVRWTIVRRAIYRKRPRKKLGGALAFALGAAASTAPRIR
jgi:hypothetical protein